MNKLTKLMLATAVFATTGFAGEITVEGTVTTRTYGSGISGTYVFKEGAEMKVTENLTINESGVLTFEKGSHGSVDAGKTITNAGTLNVTITEENGGLKSTCDGGFTLQQKDGAQLNLVGLERLESNLSGWTLVNHDTIEDGVLEGKVSKMLSKVDKAFLSPDLYDLQISVLNDDGETLHAEIANKEDAESLKAHFEKFGVALKQDDGINDTAIVVNDNKTAYDALVNAGHDTAVLIPAIEIKRDSDKGIYACLRGAEKTVTFSGESKQIVLHGDNRELNNPIFKNGETVIYSENSMPFGGEYDVLSTMVNCEIDKYATTQVTGALKVKSGKILTVKGNLVLGI